MSYNIAVAGKGGTGKTSLTGILIDYLTKEKKGETLVVDADANSNINDVLGMELNGTIGEIKEKANLMEQKREQYPGGMTKSQYLEYELNSIVEEGNGYDLLVMGRSEGEGCYCFVNSILKRQIQLMSNHYDYVVMDNEAGMEHLSRKTLREIDDLFRKKQKRKLALFLSSLILSILCFCVAAFGYIQDKQMTEQKYASFIEKQDYLSAMMLQPSKADAYEKIIDFID